MCYSHKADRTQIFKCSEQPQGVLHARLPWRRQLQRLPVGQQKHTQGQLLHLHTRHLSPAAPAPGALLPSQLPSRPGQVSLSCPCVCLHCGSGKEILSQGLCDKITSVVKMQPVTKITESGDGLGWKGSSLGFAAPREAPWAHCWGSCAWFMWRRTGADSGGSSCEPAEPISSTTAVSHGHPA